MRTPAQYLETFGTKAHEEGPYLSRYNKPEQIMTPWRELTPHLPLKAGYVAAYATSDAASMMGYQFVREAAKQGFWTVCLHPSWPRDMDRPPVLARRGEPFSVRGVENLLSRLDDVGVRPGLVYFDGFSGINWWHSDRGLTPEAEAEASVVHLKHLAMDRQIPVLIRLDYDRGEGGLYDPMEDIPSVELLGAEAVVARHVDALVLMQDFIGEGTDRLVAPHVHKNRDGDTGAFKPFHWNNYARSGWPTSAHDVLAAQKGARNA